MHLRRLLLPMCLGLLIVTLAGCQAVTDRFKPDPASTVEKFLNAVMQGNGDEAIKHVCESVVAPDLDDYLKDLPMPVAFTFKAVTMDNDEQTAHVRVTGQIELKLGPLVAKKMIDGQLALTNIGTGWCIQRDSVLPFLKEAWQTK